MGAATNDILFFDELQRMTQYKRPADVERCLKKQGIRVFWGRNGVFTTIALINAAGGIGSPGTSTDIEFEDE